MSKTNRTNATFTGHVAHRVMIDRAPAFGAIAPGWHKVAPLVLAAAHAIASSFGFIRVN